MDEANRERVVHVHGRHDTPITIISVDVNGTSVADPGEGGTGRGRKKEKAQVPRAHVFFPFRKGVVVVVGGVVGACASLSTYLSLSLCVPPLSISPPISNSFPPVSSFHPPPLSPCLSPSLLSHPAPPLISNGGELVSRACHAPTEVKTVRFSSTRVDSSSRYFSRSGKGRFAKDRGEEIINRAR